MAGKAGRSGRLTNYEQARQGKLEKLTRDYLVDNFASFPQATKIKISLSTQSRMTSQSVTSESSVELTQKQSDEIATHARTALKEALQTN